MDYKQEKKKMKLDRWHFASVMSLFGVFIDAKFSSDEYPDIDRIRIGPVIRIDFDKKIIETSAAIYEYEDIES